MDAIHSTHPVLLLLRQKLAERARKPGSAVSKADSRQQAVASDPLDRLGALAQQEGIDQRTVERLFVESVLTKEFGTDLVNDAQFQQVIERVIRTMSGDPDVANQLRDVLTHLKIKSVNPA